MREAVRVVSSAGRLGAGKGWVQLCCVAENEVRRAVGVDGVVLAESIQARAFVVERHGADAEGAKGDVRRGRRCAGHGGRGARMAGGMHGADIPEADGRIGFAGREEEVFLARGQELESGD